MNHPYGYCPKCGAPGVQRERRMNGNDLCERGHWYASTTSRSVSIQEQLGHVIRAVLDEFEAKAFFNLNATRRIMVARWAIAYLARTTVTPTPSYPGLVQAINEHCPEYLHLRSHGTVMHAMRRIESGSKDWLCVLAVDLAERAKRRMPTC